MVARRPVSQVVVSTEVRASPSVLGQYYSSQRVARCDRVVVLCKSARVARCHRVVVLKSARRPVSQGDGSIHISASVSQGGSSIQVSV